MQSSKRRDMPFIFALAFSLGSLVRRHLVATRLFATSGLGCPSRFAGGQRTAAFIPAIQGSQLGASSSPTLVFHAGWIEYLGFEAKVVHRELCLEHFIGLPGSKRSRSQCVVMKEQFQFKRLSPRLASPSKVARFVVTPPPNPSFKRTCLRHAA